MRIKAANITVPGGWKIFIPVLLAASAPFINTLSMGFVWDDFYLINDNTLIRSLANIPDFFASNLSAGSTFFDPAVPYYRPAIPSREPISL